MALQDNYPQIPGLSDEDQQKEEAALLTQTPQAPSSSLGMQVGPWDQIPKTEMHEAGKMAYAQLMPKITADLSKPGGLLDWQRQRQEQLEFEKAHPWGAPISKHPGTFGTILHGIARGANIAGDIIAPGVMENIPGTEMHRDMEQQQLQRGIERGEQLENQGEEASAAETRANAEKENADTAAKTAGQPKPKEEEWDVVQGFEGPNGEPILREKNSGQMKLATLSGAKPTKQEKPDSPEQQFIDDEMKHGKTIEQAEGDYARLKPNQEPGSFLPMYDPKSGALVGAWDPKSGRMVMPPANLHGATTSQGATLENKETQQNAASSSAMKSFQRYQQSFHQYAPKLTDDDREAMKVLASHQDTIAHGLLESSQAGILDTMLGQPLTGYSEKLMGGTMTKDQYDKLSSGGKKMLADYFHAIIANFINMKQRMGTAGSRNQAMIQAEMNAIPLPYIDPDSADAMFKDTLEDIQNASPNANGGRRVIDLTK